MNTTPARSIPYWLLIVLSLAAAAAGGWLIASQVGTMTSTLLDGTATGVEVYVGQAIVTVGAALLGAGVLGILLALVLAAARALLPARTPAAVETEEIATPVETTDAEDAAHVADIPADADAVQSPAEDIEPSDAVEPEPAITR